MPKVERVIHPTTWIREIHVGQLKITNVSLDKRHSIVNMISDYNRSWGAIAGKFIHYSYNSYGCRLAIYAVSSEERKQELNKETDEGKWKEKLPIDFYGKKEWETESEHD